MPAPAKSAACPSCAWSEPAEALFCRRCGADFTPEPPVDWLLYRLECVRRLARNRVWSRLAAEVKNLGQHLEQIADPSDAVHRSLGWLADEIDALVAADHELPRIIKLSRVFLPLVPSNPAAELSRRATRLENFYNALVAAEESWSQGPHPADSALDGWWRNLVRDSGLSPDQALATVRATPALWPHVIAFIAPATPPIVAQRSVLARAADLARKRNFAAAKPLYQDVLSDDGSCIPAYEGLAKVAAGLGDRELAIQMLRQAARLGTGEFLTYNNLSWALSTASSPTAADLDEAVWLARRAVEIAPLETCFDTLAEALWKQGKLREAAVALRGARRLSPDHSEYRDRLQRLCGQMNLSPFRSLLDRLHAAKDVTLQTLALEDSDFPVSADNAGQTFQSDRFPAAPPVNEPAGDSPFNALPL